jgi:hypothetical protein
MFINIHFISDTDNLYRWVFRRILVGDGNFKADHVRLLKELDDFWLSEGGGMFAKRDEYFSFLATAIERLTVCIDTRHRHSRDYTNLQLPI